MSLYIASLNSGSNGNCYYVGNSSDAVLVDAGLTYKETEKRMQRIGLSMQLVRAIFITHEHGDHIRGVVSLSVKYQLPVYITPPTLKGCGFLLDEALVRPFNAHAAINIGSLAVTPLPKQHDAADPYSFVVEGNGIKVGVLTDIGAPCQNVIRYFSACHAAILEANYDDGMLERGRYPYFLKKRISGNDGHLSNTQALELFTNHRSPLLSHLILGHLSKTNNDPELVYRMFSEYAGNTNIVVASRYKESTVYCINGARHESAASIILPRYNPVQISLF